MSKVAVIDYGMGNLHSVAKALEFVARTANLSVEVVVTADPKIIDSADRVIFPGVGAIRDCMAEILRLNIDRIVKEAIKTKPLLAICVGMQALMQHSEENHGVDCLGILPGRVRYFGADLRDTPVVKLEGERLKVPHMGWNCVAQTRRHPLWQNIPDQSRFYFVHSYYVEAGKPEQVMGTTSYGVDFCAALSERNIFAVQFHPEKSQTAGLTLLRNFLLWDGAR